MIGNNPYNKDKLIHQSSVLHSEDKSIMQRRTYRWQLIVSLICVMVVTTACFRAGVDEEQPNAVSQRITDEPTDLPTNTPTEDILPTLEPTTEVAEATVQVIAAIDTDTPTPTETPTPTATDTPTNTPTATATETEVFVAQSLFSPTPNGAAQAIDPFQLTATQLVASATFGAGIPFTQTAIFLQGPSATPTATATFANVQTDGGFGVTTIPQQGGVVTDGGINLNGQDCVHEVRRGDNLFRISIYYGVPINQIATYSTNNITNPNIISLGQRIIIPGCGTTPGLPPPTSTPGPDGFNTPITGGCTRPYTVQQGDTLFSISLRCGVSVLDLQYANRIINPNYIDIGTVLTIP
jgi:LysM repeat protein